MTNDFFVQYVLNYIYQNNIQNNKNLYIAGIFKKDVKAQQLLKQISVIESVVIRSIQSMNYRRTMRFFALYRTLIEKANNYMSSINSKYLRKSKNQIYRLHT
jgi:hypothetical protein